jgi:hypothetical protein
MSFRILSGALWSASASFVLAIAVMAPFVGAGQLPLVGNMLSRSNVTDRAAPILILSLFGWVLLSLFARTLRVHREHKAIDTFQMQVALVDTENYKPKPYRRDDVRVNRRADFIIDGSRRNLASLHETVPAAAALDASMLAASYRPLHVYAWILPVLGFIGTASGMASAIDGFKGALRGGQGQVEALANQLSQSVIPGLSAAFETTILALAASLVAYLCTSALMAWDQEALDHLDAPCVELLSRTPQRDELQAGKVAAVLEQISDRLRAPLELPADLGAAAEAFRKASELLASASKEFNETAKAPYHVTISRGAPP